MSGIHLVWFKRDLRITDHQPLLNAAKAGRVLPLYVWEPDLMQQPDFAAQHAGFIHECLTDLDHQFQLMGARLQIACADVVRLFERIHAITPIEALYSHEETGNLWTYRRDMAVEAWCSQQGVAWHQWRQDGVLRRLSNRDYWSTHWETFFAAAPVAQPLQIDALTLSELGLTDSACQSPQHKVAEDKPLRQKGGSKRAHQLLHSFLTERGLSYRYAMSSPNSAPKHCSRLSAHLAYGSLSMRQLIHSLRGSQQQWRQESPAHPDRTAWLKSLASFESRLHWHCHFMQKLEMQPTIETHNLHPALDEIERPFNEALFHAFCTGQTGYPFVDACIRRLAATGWINFRMRAMLVSFACNLLWLPWQPVAHFLARQFIDYEPGIHYPQIQMQAGTTGMNVLRIYNPIKQSQDQDPKGLFIRTWLPELAMIPDELIHTPWLLTRNLQQRYGLLLEQDYPLPIVDYVIAARAAKEKIYGLRRLDENRVISRQLLVKHGSRLTSTRKRRTKEQPCAGDNPQLSFGF